MGKMLRTIGLMSGTSLDGVDAAWLETDGAQVGAAGPTVTLPYDDRLRADLRRILDLAPTLRPDDRRLKAAEARLTEYHIRAVAALDRPADLIGFHGQTILHQPDRRRTWQIGDAATLAWRTGVPVACDFRSADVAAGGQGAPLAPVFHAALARDLPCPLAVLNIGGVANVTWIGADGELVAFDTGPGQRAAGRLDRAPHGCALRPRRRAGAGGYRGCCGAGPPAGASVFPATGAEIAGPAGFRRRAGGERCGCAVARGRRGHAGCVHRRGGGPCAAAGAAAALAGGRGRAAQPGDPGRALRHRLAAPVEPVEAVGWDGDALEAQCFGFLAARVAAGLPLSFPGTTGVPAAMPGGQIVRP